MSYSSSRMPGASISRKTAGCGPCRSGWTMNVFTVPARVAMSWMSSIMSHSHGVCSLFRGWSHDNDDRASASAPGNANEPQAQETGDRIDDCNRNQNQQDHV